MRFVVFVEGETENRGLGPFLQRWLDAKLEAKRVVVKVCNLKGVSHFLKKLPKRAKEYLEGERRKQTLAVIGLLDLYGPDRHNWYEDNDGRYTDGDERTHHRVRFGKSKIEKTVSHSRFWMFFAVHETEAWILSQPDLLPPDLRKSIKRNNKDPEDVNFNLPPAKLLDEAYRKATGKSYKKTVHGADLLKRLDPQIAYDKYPYLRELLDEMLKLAGGANP